jgi:AcrR family transcriptional regulator
MSANLKSADRKEQILETALRLAEKMGYTNITRAGVADAAGVAPSLVSHYFTTMGKMKRAVMRQAVKRAVLSIVAQGLTLKDDQALKAPEELRARAAASLKG